jgi:uncharacterized protein
MQQRWHDIKEPRVAEDLIGYDALTQDAMRSVVRAALTRAASPRGLPGRHHFYVTFRTHAPGVVIPPVLSSRYPEEMTIVLEHQFWDLEVFSDRFRVILKFGGQPHSIVVPFMALTRFFDPYVRFGLQFDTAGEQLAAMPEEDDATAAVAEDEVDDREPGSVVSLDAFRKK